MRRKSLQNIINNSTKDQSLLEEDDFNDDEAEKNLSRKKFDEDNSNMESIFEHYKNCIQLSAENKINTKNAFSLHLIDFIGTLLKKKDKQMDDFSTVGCTLDAGIKIYACRVDAVHLDVMKLATGLHTSNKKSRKDENDLAETNDDSDSSDSEGDSEQKEDEAEENKEKKKKAKRIANKPRVTVVTNLDQINRKKSDSESFNSRLRLLNCEVGIVSNCIFDTDTLSLSIDDKKPFWKNHDLVKHEAFNKNYSIQLPDIPKEAVICPSFSDFSFDGGISPTDLSITRIVQDRFDVNVTAGYNESTAAATVPSDIESDFGDELEQCPTYQVSSSSTFAQNRRTTTTNLSNFLANNSSDYYYFNSHLLSAWVERARDMKHWNPFRNNSKDVQKQGTRKVKKCPLIDFRNTSGLEIVYNGACVPKSLHSNWAKLKLVSMSHMSFDKNEFFRLSSWNTVYSTWRTKDSKIGKTTCIVLDNGHQAEFENSISNFENPIDIFDNATSDDARFVNSFGNQDNDGDYPSDVHEAIIFAEDTTTELPAKVAKMNMQSIMKDKVIKIKELKEEMWDKIIEPQLEKSNTDDGSEVLTFAELCTEMIENSKQKEQLSMAVLFNAALQLANDKSLEFRTVEKLNDFTISK